MERWQEIYLIVIAVGFVIGFYFPPIVAVGFIWVAIIATEIVQYWRELREAEKEVEV